MVAMVSNCISWASVAARSVTSIRCASREACAASALRWTTPRPTSASNATSGAATMAMSLVRILTLSNTWCFRSEWCGGAASPVGATAPVGHGHVRYPSDARHPFQGPADDRHGPAGGSTRQDLQLGYAAPVLKGGCP